MNSLVLSLFNAPRSDLNWPNSEMTVAKAVALTNGSMISLLSYNDQTQLTLKVVCSVAKRRFWWSTGVPC